MTNANMALRRARQIGQTTTWKAKCKAVHVWRAALEAMLNGTH